MVNHYEVVFICLFFSFSIFHLKREDIMDVFKVFENLPKLRNPMNINLFMCDSSRMCIFMFLIFLWTLVAALSSIVLMFQFPRTLFSLSSSTFRQQMTPFAMLSHAAAGIRGSTLVRPKFLIPIFFFLLDISGKILRYNP